MGPSTNPTNCIAGTASLAVCRVDDDDEHSLRLMFGGRVGMGANKKKPAPYDTEYETEDTYPKEKKQAPYDTEYETEYTYPKEVSD